MSYFCYERTYGGDCGSPSCCSPATTEEMQNFQSSMAQCIGAAVSAGLNVAVSPHLDDGLGYGGWRNGLLLNPVENYGGMTYQDFMLNPLADAINSVITDNTQVDFAMQVNPPAGPPMRCWRSRVLQSCMLKDRLLCALVAGVRLRAACHCSLQVCCSWQTQYGASCT